MDPITLKVAFTKSVGGIEASSMTFARFPAAGDFVEFGNHGFRVRGLIHEARESFVGAAPGLCVLLEPVDSFVE